MSDICSNCHTQIDSEDQYCAKCGQSTQSFERPFIPFLVNLLHELFDIDGRLWLTLKTLVTKPGVASYEYSQGKRVKYTPALRVYLVVSVVFFLLFASMQGLSASNTEASSSSFDLYPKAMFLLFPFFAFLVSCFYRQSYYINNLILSMHIHSITYLVLILIAPLERLEQKFTTLILLQAPVALYFIWYFLSAFKVMFKESWLKTAIKSLSIYFLYMAALGFVFDELL